MRVKTVSNSEHGPRHVTPAGRSVFHDLFPKSRLKQSEVAKVLRISKVRVLDLERGKIDRFRLDFLVRLAVRAGLKPRLKLAA